MVGGRVKRSVGGSGFLFLRRVVDSKKIGREVLLLGVALFFNGMVKILLWSG